ncbi:ComEC/Rec2 family competence protein [Halosquirtibacter xylanolyticus]|uniref:ComEC/Rec2 family competence protein n=1 Tax=Halosquirtibacter xylanolyticus TaxID=3374599 RepID=UPI00374847DE|nr:ComEC/Rec2 family competence protein [Prolixibacteraceae bacterium]
MHSRIQHKPAPLFPISYAFILGLGISAYHPQGVIFYLILMLSFALFVYWSPNEFRISYTLLQIIMVFIGIFYYPSELQSKSATNGRHHLIVVEDRGATTDHHAYEVQSVDKQKKVVQFLMYTDTIKRYCQGDLLSAQLYFFKSEDQVPSYLWDYSNHLRSQGISSTAYASEIVTVEEGEQRPSYLLNSIKQYMSTVWHDDRLSQPQQAIYEALLLGQRSSLPSKMVSIFQHLGIAHILAMSGLHLSLLLGIITMLLAPLLFFRCTRAVAFIIAWLISLLFILSIHASVSLYRAITMLSIGFIYILFAKQQSSLHIWSLVVIGTLIVVPEWISSLSFQLSIVSVLGILWLTPQLEALYYPKRQTIRYIFTLIYASFAAQVATLPLVLYHFHQWNPLSLFWNLIAVPIATIEIYTGILLLLLHPVDIVVTYLSKFINLVTTLFFDLCEYIDTTVVHGFTNQYLYPATFVMIAITIIILCSTIIREYPRCSLLFISIGWAVTVPIYSGPHIIWRNNKAEQWVLFVSQKQNILWYTPSQRHPDDSYYLNRIKPILAYYHSPWHLMPQLEVDSIQLRNNEFIHLSNHILFLNGHYPRDTQLFEYQQKQGNWKRQALDDISQGDITLKPTELLLTEGERKRTKEDSIRHRMKIN